MHLAEALSSTTGHPSLHTLSLQSNTDITDKGASSLLNAIYNPSSVNAIIESNHILRAINLQGCTSVSTHILTMAEKFSSQCTNLKSSKDVIRLKMSKYLKDNLCIGSTEFDVSFNVELMPYVLSFISASGSYHHLYQVLKSWNMPLLYVHGSRHQEPIFIDEEYPTGEEKRGSKSDEETSSEFHQFMEDYFTPATPKRKHGVNRINVVFMGIHRTSPILRHYKNGRNRNIDTNSVQLSDMLCLIPKRNPQVLILSFQVGTSLMIQNYHHRHDKFNVSFRFIGCQFKAVSSLIVVYGRNKCVVFSTRSSSPQRIIVFMLLSDFTYLRLLYISNEGNYSSHALIETNQHR